MKKTLLLIDGHALIFRAFYGVPLSMSLSTGQPINAIYGFLSQVFSALEICNPDYFALCLDRPEPTFRDALYDQYKAHRPEPPQELISQLKLLPEVISGLGLPTFERPGFESDDIIGTLATQADRDGMNVQILTGDMDILQLASDSIHILKPGRNKPEFEEFGPIQVQEKYGITPAQIIDYKALKGDTSDNIPGVKGIGDKTAVALLNTYGNLDTLYARLDEITSKSIQTKLRENKDMAFLSRTLATLKCDMELNTAMSDLVFNPDWTKILALFSKFEFKSLIQRYQKKNPHPPTIAVPLSHTPPSGHPSQEGNFTASEDTNSPSVDRGWPAEALRRMDGVGQQLGIYETIADIKSLEKLLPALQSGFAIDLETTALAGVEAQIVGVALAVEPGKGYYIPLNAFLSKAETQVSVPLFAATQEKAASPEFKLNPFLVALKPLLENPDIPKCAHNGKYEILVLKNYDIELNGLNFDTMIAAFLLDPTNRVGLKDLAKRHLNIDMTHYEDVTGHGKAQVNFKDVPIDQATQYAAADADVTLRLKTLFEAKLNEKPLLRKLFDDIEIPLVTVLAKMEHQGVSIDRAHLSHLSTVFQARLNELRKDVVCLVGFEFNLASPKQVASVLFDTLQLPILKKTKTGPSTDASVLEKLKNKHPVAEKLLQHRMLEKLMTTYINALPNLISIRTGKIHTSFNQTVALTGRLSSVTPNLQNIPIRTEEGRQIRGAIIPSSSKNLILSADYSQIELRILAHLSQDPHMIEAFQNKEDIHVTTAALIHHIPKEAVTNEQRSHAKSVNFGIIYGISDYGLSEQLGITRAEAKVIIEAYFARFSKIHDFIQDTLQKAKETGYVVTEFGRIRPVPEIHSSVFHQRQFAERVAVNTRVQGTAADVIKLAMIGCQNRLEREKRQSHMIIQVHDELVFDILKSEEESMRQLVSEEMRKAVHFSVPMEVDISVGKSWQEA